MSRANFLKFPGILILLFAGLVAGKQDLPAATNAFRTGNAAYEQGHYEEAATAYKAAIDAGASDARLYYNQGNTLFRLNKLGEAILAYERARKLAPADADIAFNLRFAQSRIVDKISEPPRNAFTQALWDLHAGYSLRAGVWAAFTLLALGFGVIVFGLFLNPLGRIATTVFALLAFCGLLAFSPSLWIRIQHQETRGRAVVLEPVAELYSGPGEKHELLFRAHEGTTFDIVERRGEWLSVKLPDGKGGFIRAAKTGEV